MRSNFHDVLKLEGKQSIQYMELLMVSLMMRKRRKTEKVWLIAISWKYDSCCSTRPWLSWLGLSSLWWTVEYIKSTNLEISTELGKLTKLDKALLAYYLKIVEGVNMGNYNKKDTKKNLLHQFTNFPFKIGFSYQGVYSLNIYGQSYKFSCEVEDARTGV